MSLSVINRRDASTWSCRC